MKLKIKFENIFVVLSILFLGICCFYYGFRLVKYYKVFNPKTETGEKTEVFSASVRKNNPVITENDGLYILNGDFVFRGENVNNYVSYNDRIWRIMRVNRSGSVKLILDESLTDMAFDSNDKSYELSEVYNYIKENTNIKESGLEKMTVCLDKIDDNNKLTCETKVDEYVALVSLSDYANSLNTVTGKSFINNTKNIWLSSQTTDGLVWNIVNGTLKVTDATKEYSVKPTIVLKGTAYTKQGVGSKEDPYVVKDGE